MTLEFVARGICVESLSNASGLFATLGFAQAGPSRPITCSALPGSSEAGAMPGRYQVLRDGKGVELMLVAFDHADPRSNRQRRPNNQYGLTHLAFWVEDLEQAAARWIAAGGTVLWHTRALFQQAQVSLMYTCDTVGTRIELMQRPAAGSSFSHSGLCTHDPARSQQFYQAVGFTAGDRFDLQHHSEWLDIINELEDVRLCAQMVVDHKGTTLELLDIQHPACSGELNRLALNSYGFNFLVFRSTNLERAARLIEEHGGAVHYRADAAGALHGLSCSDPDGVRLEIVAA